MAFGREQVGRSDPQVTLRIYAKVLKRVKRQHGRRVAELLEGAQEDDVGQRLGSKTTNAAPTTPTDCLGETCGILLVAGDSQGAPGRI